MSSFTNSIASNTDIYDCMLHDIQKGYRKYLENNNKINNNIYASKEDNLRWNCFYIYKHYHF